jgi:hypothetical protein
MNMSVSMPMVRLAGLNPSRSAQVLQPRFSGQAEDVIEAGRKAKEAWQMEKEAGWAETLKTNLPTKTNTPLTVAGAVIFLLKSPDCNNDGHLLNQLISNNLNKLLQPQLRHLLETGFFVEDQTGVHLTKKGLACLSKMSSGETLPKLTDTFNYPCYLY